ncbi:hypothetical protein LXT21_40460 [Myxococcus sp. K38C18041901]|uniref:hypothetical protein n=1 Tax=Myxococcus guangdongensis TaxID=2906760 RepID=UPI0020A74AB6|nr:hypothetical protein [Myxococcus guangdongensis]MCP3065063.1 hypothetical protein [Myxococcus guangdongensis]
MLRPAAGGPKGATLYAVGGLGLAFVAAMVNGCFFFYPVLYGEELKEPFATGLGMLAMLCAFGGVSLSFISRDLGRGTGAMLPMVGIVANALLTGLLVLLSVVGVFM